MAYRNYFRSVLNDNFKILTWILILFIAITPNFIFMNTANASSVGGWLMGNPIAQGASVVYEGTKTIVLNGADYVKKGTAKITPTATSVSKVLSRGAAGYALSVAVEQLLGSVDWVLDPANNRVIYTEETITLQGQPQLWLQPQIFADESTEDTYFNNKFLTASAACSALIRSDYGTFDRAELGSNGIQLIASCYYTNNQNETLLRAYVNQVENKFYEQVQEEEKYIPLPTLAEKVISNAAGGDINAKAAITAAAADIVAEAETDNVKARPIAQQLEASASTKPADEAVAAQANTVTGTQTQNPTKPEVTDLALEFPEFCNWSPIICEAAQTAVNFMTDFEPDAESGEVTIHEDNDIIFDDSERISFSSSCPAPEQFSVSFFGASQDLEFSYQPLCDFMSMIKPFVVAGSYLIGAYIVMGLSRGSAE